MLQDKLFSDFEGDRWFERNRESLNSFSAAADLPLKLIELYGLAPRRVLEIGAANGFRLAAIQRLSGAKAVAVEPSARAVRDGKTSFPCISFIRGTASAVPLRAGFDLVIVNFVLHWIDRQSLMGAAAEVDRLVSDGGYLVIGDFSPANRMRVRYHHLQSADLYTFKQDYAALFVASGLYHTVSFLSAHHASRALHGQVEENERTGAWLLRKELNAHYLESGGTRRE